LIQNRYGKVGDFPPAIVCFISAFIVTLLRDGYHFDVNARDIIYATTFEGNDVRYVVPCFISSYAADMCLAGHYIALIDTVGH
jgi:hypothetical protein